MILPRQTQPVLRKMGTSPTLELADGIDAASEPTEQEPLAQKIRYSFRCINGFLAHSEKGTGNAKEGVVTQLECTGGDTDWLTVTTG
jgi:hypothetical protein